MSQYHFITHWNVEASPEEVYHLLEDVTQLPVWWPAVYLDLIITKPGQASGIGKEVTLYTKGWLPYTLLWKFKVIAIDFPKGFALQAFGDFVGKGVWTFSEGNAPGQCNITYDWQIQAEKPLLKYLSFLLKPLFAANHLWAMRMGEISLKLELQRRKAKNTAELAKVPAPPPPTFPHNWMNNKILSKSVDHENS